MQQRPNAGVNPNRKMRGPPTMAKQAKCAYSTGIRSVRFGGVPGGAVEPMSGAMHAGVLGPG